MKWMLSLVLSLSCLGGVVCAGDSTSLAHNVNDQISLEELIKAYKADNINQAAGIISNIKNVNCQTSGGKTALMIASRYGDKQRVKILIGRKANRNLLTVGRYTALMVAAKKGHKEIVEMLLEPKAKVLVQILLKRTPNKDLQSNDGYTALMVAAQNGHKEVVELLLGHKAHANMQTYDGYTALMLAAQNGHTEVVELLLKRKVTSLVRDHERCRGLMLAAQGGHKKMVEFFLNHSININERIYNGGNALRVAVQNRHDEIVEMLLNHVNQPGNNGITPLMLAAQSGYEKMVELLLKHKAHANMQTYEGYTALMISVQNGHKGVAELLIGHDADTELKLKENNRTAFDILDNLSDYGISLEDEKIQYLKYILNGARVLDKLGLNSALTEYPQAKEMLVKRVLMRINKVYKEDLAIRDINGQQAQSNPLPISNLLRVEKEKLKSIQDNYMPILDRVYKDEYFKQQAIEAGHFAEYQSKKYVFRSLSKAIKTQRFSDLVIYTQDNF